MRRWLPVFILSCLFLSSSLFAAEDNVLNLYTWSGVIPESIIQQFEKETGIKVNFSTYDSNETMYAKLKATTDGGSGYDVIEPSSYYIDRMGRQGMLEKLDKSKLSHFKNEDPAFLNQSYDPHNRFSVPFIWGVTGIFQDTNEFSQNRVTGWADLWDKKYDNQLMLLDDSREVFAMALLALGYSINDANPEHIKQAYLKLKELSQNVKVFKSDGVITILIDEDVGMGMAWNGDVYKAKKENPLLDFIFPKEGFVIWVDSFAIPLNAPHRENAHRFLNFMMRADIAKMASLANDYPTTNLAAKKLLPKEIRDNPIIYPSHAVLQRGQYQTDIPDEALELYERYWEKLKMEG
ncbi:MAG TPA: spermidine/putrescine ABC transporter substrate-binding protein [Gammaproteobacteria bacterium]|nr:spermidine/putrescine ABC transporter substrate-binding protein [Gammaproteobacteria bacterium]